MSESLPRIYPAESGLLGAEMRQSPEDFQVTELLPFVPSGMGAHHWLVVEKRGLNTQDVAQRLARCAGVAVRDVGFAGLKDRQAVT
ncbi:tRNA pseudouridine(13) synthase TruD, partial [Acidithiobacillus ferridurans]|nr:tRNA pseudouridine(13) synthase TruD [Acidithiobacillus ferridurans]